MGEIVAGSRSERARPRGRRADRRLRASLHAGPRPAPRHYLHEPTRTRSRRRRGRPHRRRPGPAADAAAGHRPRALARLDRTRPRDRPGAAAGHALRARQRPGRALRRSSRPTWRASPSWRARSGTHEFAQAVRSEIEARCDPRSAASFLQAMPPETLWSGLDRYWRRRSSCCYRCERTAASERRRAAPGRERRSARALTGGRARSGFLAMLRRARRSRNGGAASTFERVTE